MKKLLCTLCAFCVIFAITSSTAKAVECNELYSQPACDDYEYLWSIGYYIIIPPVLLSLWLYGDNGYYHHIMAEAYGYSPHDAQDYVGAWLSGHLIFIVPADLGAFWFAVLDTHGQSECEGAVYWWLNNIKGWSSSSAQEYAESECSCW